MTCALECIEESALDCLGPMGQVHVLHFLHTCGCHLHVAVQCLKCVLKPQLSTDAGRWVDDFSPRQESSAFRLLSIIFYLAEREKAFCPVPLTSQSDRRAFTERHANHSALRAAKREKGGGRSPALSMVWTLYAGKTTILGMLTRRIQPTSGDALVDGQSVLSSSGQGHAVLGFCPQQDPLMDLLTGREHLALYARLKVRLKSLRKPGCRTVLLNAPCNVSAQASLEVTMLHYLIEALSLLGIIGLDQVNLPLNRQG